MARYTYSNSESEAGRRTSVYHSNGNGPGSGAGGSAGTNGAYGGSENSSSGHLGPKTKQRLTAAQQQHIKELLQRHVTNNDPRAKPLQDPHEFEHYSDEFLRKYCDRYGLDCPDNMTLAGYLLGSALGSKTQSWRKNKPGQPGARVTKQEVALAVKKHFATQSVREADCIPQFLYKIKNRGRRFRMEFKG